MNCLELGTRDFHLQISARNGAIAGVWHEGKEIALPSKFAFALRMLDRERNYRIIDSSMFSSFQYRQEENKLVRRWENCAECPGMEVVSEIGFDGEVLRFRSRVINIPADWELELVDCPCVTISSRQELFWPRADGILVDEPEKTHRWYQQIEAPDHQSWGFYPGPCSMQFFASYDKESGNGLMFMADDRSHGTKMLEFSSEVKEDNSRIRLRIECYTGHDGNQKEYEIPFDLIIRPFQGDWRDACIIYRKWAEADPVLRDFPKSPEWLQKSPVVVVLAVRGGMNIGSGENPYSDYQQAFPRLKQLSEEFDSPLLVLLMRWDQHGPWLPPYCWPPAGSLESYMKLRDLLHESGNYFGVYCSGTAYTVKSLMNDYDNTEVFEKERLSEYMCSGPHGEVITTDPGLRTGTHFCLTEDFGNQIMLDQFRKIAESGVDYIQFFDQNLGCMNYPCYAENHQHPAVPGEWMTSSMQHLLAEMDAIAKSVNPNLLIGTESSAAMPYLRYLPLNDARSQILVHWGRPVPGNAFVFHKFSNNFLGNQSPLWYLIDCLACPENLCWRIACGFSAGQMLTVTLRSNGEISWGAADDPKQPAPDQKSATVLIRNLNRMRREYPQFLRDGDAEKPISILNCGTYTVHLRNNKGDRVVPSILLSAWRSPDGEFAEFMVNYLNHEQHYQLNGKDCVIAPLQAVKID